MHLSFQIQFQDLPSFFDHWSSKYKYKSEEKYTDNIGNPLTEESLRQLFEWKNGIEKIAGRKVQSIAANYNTSFKDDPATRYLDHKQSGSAIWNIFYLHCLLPREWPIFDQHVFRAMRYMKTGKIEEIPGTSKRKYEVYQQEYIPFFKAFGGMEQRKVDTALFAFGKFLKTAVKYA
ncbi:hypothetical protein [Pseudomonas sp. UW4]|uniref:hypothetical protein n=1 Tax=Pseudomonas sp. UW4 TaxID=1207075 RepID=UPI00029D3BCC|nr:hypothetical protein [Pseudomonas sp. UW4]AFY19330.1 hypothetical protein PputUW4_02130 [Pseudomonas sp. UW4]